VAGKVGGGFGGMNAEYKQCSKCHQLKLVGEFFSNGKGRHSSCSCCHMHSHAIYRAANREKLNIKSRAYKRAYYAKNKEKMADYAQAYYAKNFSKFREKRNAANRARYHARVNKLGYEHDYSVEKKADRRARWQIYAALNREKIAERKRAWYFANKAKFRAKQIAYEAAKRSGKRIMSATHNFFQTMQLVGQQQNQQQ
jgi:hypothetical protein